MYLTTLMDPPHLLLAHHHKMASDALHAQNGQDSFHPPPTPTWYTRHTAGVMIVVCCADGVACRSSS